MLLKNTGDKILNVGRDILMPGEEKNYPDGIIGDGTLSVLISMGFLQVSMEKKEKAPKSEAEKAPAPSPFAPRDDAWTAPEEKKPTRKSVRKPAQTQES